MKAFFTVLLIASATAYQNAAAGLVSANPNIPLGVQRRSTTYSPYFYDRPVEILDPKTGIVYFLDTEETFYYYYLDPATNQTVWFEG